jgi:oxygen-independent coproporphyrinogen-3 oxidase
MPPAHPQSEAGLYIHVPFCTSVCPYCDFAVTIAGDERRTAWVEGVIREAESHADIGLRFDTVYFGGGTPSSLGLDQIHRILDAVRRCFEVARDALVFLEANPEDVSSGSAAVWRDLGIGFVSLGVQSLDDDDLRHLGRRHGVAEALRALGILCESGFQTVSVDLIYGIAGRSTDHWRQQLESIVALDVDHLSCYQLTVHEETLLGRRVAHGVAAEMGEEELGGLFFLTHEMLADAGFEAYEVSNFASAPEHRSRHNQKYWQHAPYLGLGPSAHSFVHDRRWWNRRKLRLWQAAVDAGENPIEGEEKLSHEQLLLEELMLGLRTAAGVEIGRLRDQYGVDLLASNSSVIDRLCASGHLVIDGSRLRPTLAGLANADTLARSFEL